MPRDRWFRVEGTHEAIIDRETFETVQRNLDIRSREDGTGMVHPLAGLVKCMDCGSTMSKTSNGKKGKRRYIIFAVSFMPTAGQRSCVPATPFGWTG